ncbi:MAG: UDP-N-acetylglucosamine 2-epimerase (non-hydrolyzing) [candidate division Zixibacteria bacterium]|nr:UDP-N-acetylglucosamine 2-epimerase (non-hydrolyzing) [candidate division Zixibacteria bacterium]
MKIAPLWREQKKYSNDFESILLHTGQHYDYQMSQRIFGDLDLPKPDIYLNVGSGSHAEQTAKVMIPFEKCLKELEPDLVLVVGDVNSTLACAVVASKMHIPVAHVEAGLRSFDRTMPEEINRLLTDQLADYLFVTENSAITNLIHEGRPIGRIFFSGNVMIDSLVRSINKSDDAILDKFKLNPDEYALVTLHRPSNVDDPETLKGIINALIRISESVKVIFPVHPRTRKNFKAFYLDDLINSTAANLIVCDPVGYLDFIALERDAKMVLTDSGGIQEECCYMKIPCLTLRYNTERPVTIDCGSNKLTGSNPENIVQHAMGIINNPPTELHTPDKWDGRAAVRIIEEIRWLFEMAPKSKRPLSVKV